MIIAPNDFIGKKFFGWFDLGPGRRDERFNFIVDITHCSRRGFLYGLGMDGFGNSEIIWEINRDNLIGIKRYQNSLSVGSFPSSSTCWGNIDLMGSIVSLGNVGITNLLSLSGTYKAKSGLVGKWELVYPGIVSLYGKDYSKEMMRCIEQEIQSNNSTKNL